MFDDKFPSLVFKCSYPPFYYHYTPTNIFFIIQGSKRLKLANSDDYNLIHIKNDTEDIIDDEASFDNLPKNSILKFKKRPPNAIALAVPLDQNVMSNDQEVGKLRRKLEKLQQNMEIMLTFSGNDLRLLADKQGNLLKGIDNKTLEGRD